MNTPHATETLAVPVRTDADVLARVAAIISGEAREVPALWVFFLDAGGMQSNVIVPIDGIPDLPDPEFVGNVCHVITQVLADTVPGGSAVITLTRSGEADPGGSDLHWLAALARDAERYSTPVRMLCLATPAGVRELGPARTG